MTEDKTEDKKERTPSAYLIFETMDGGVTLKLVGEQPATSSAEAQRLYFADRDDHGDFIAVSARSFQITRRAPDTVIKTTVKALGPPSLPKTISADPDPLPVEDKQPADLREFATARSGSSDHAELPRNDAGAEVVERAGDAA